MEKENSLAFFGQNMKKCVFSLFFFHTCAQGFLEPEIRVTAEQFALFFRSHDLSRFAFASGLVQRRRIDGARRTRDRKRVSPARRELRSAAAIAAAVRVARGTRPASHCMRHAFYAKVNADF